ncbi:MAG: hypothetical protein K6E59_05230 [Bacilli bacterium]|nr:hypothetical protein [Bacilli bacterium]
MVLNAFCHANHYVRSNIKIEFFPSECRVTSPGGIYHATLEDLLDGIQTYRNPRLVNVFDKLGLIENYGTGIPRTLEAYVPFDEKPLFKPSDNSFIVRLPNLNSPQRKQSERSPYPVAVYSVDSIELYMVSEGAILPL